MMTPDLLFFLTLICIPWGVGLLIGLLRKEILVLILVFIVFIAGFFMNQLWLNTLLQTRFNFSWLAGGMAVLWACIGYRIGNSAQSYFRIVGWQGLGFTLLVALIGTALVGILIEGIFPWGIRSIGRLTNGGSILVPAGDMSPLGGTLNLYIPILGLSFILSLLLGIRLTKKIWVGGIFKVFAILSVLGIVNLALDLTWGQFLQRILWWVPEIEPPQLYGLFFSLSLATLLALPIHNPGFTLKAPLSIDEDTRILIAQKREEEDSLVTWVARSIKKSYSPLKRRKGVRK